MSGDEQARLLFLLGYALGALEALDQSQGNNVETSWIFEEIAEIAPKLGERVRKVRGLGVAE